MKSSPIPNIDECGLSCLAIAASISALSFDEMKAMEFIPSLSVLSWLFQKFFPAKSKNHSLSALLSRNR